MNPSSSTTRKRSIRPNPSRGRPRPPPSQPPPPPPNPPQEQQEEQQDPQDPEDPQQEPGPMANYVAAIGEPRFVAKYEELQARDLFPSRCFKLVDFHGTQWSAPTCFANQKMTSLLRCTKEYYPELVRMFYSTLTKSTSDPPVLTAYVKHTRVTITHGLLCQLFGLEDKGSRIFSMEGYPSGYDFHNDLQFVWNPNRPDMKRSITLPIHSRILLKMLNYTILPKWTHKERVSFMEVITMAHLLNPNRRLDIAYIMLHIMERASALSKKKIHLPYGPYLTRVFEHFDVGLYGEKSERSPENNKQILSHMSIQMTQDGLFTVMGTENVVPLVPPRVDEAGPSVIPPAAGPSVLPSTDFARLMTAIADLSTTVNDRFDRSDAFHREQYAALNARIDNLGASSSRQFSDLTHTVDGMRDQLIAFCEGPTRDDAMVDDDDGGGGGAGA